MHIRYDDDADSAENASGAEADTTSEKTDGTVTGTNADNDDAAQNQRLQSKTANDERQYQTGLKHFREVLEDWEAFILDDQSLA